MEIVNFDDIAVILRYEGPKMAADFQHNILYLWHEDTEGNEDYGSLWLVYDLSAKPDIFYAFFQGDISLQNLEIQGQIKFGRLATGRKILKIDDSFAFVWDGTPCDEDYTEITSAYKPKISCIGSKLQFCYIEYGDIYQAFSVKVDGYNLQEADFTNAKWSSFAKELCSCWNNIYFKETGYVIFNETLLFSSSSTCFASVDRNISELDSRSQSYSNIYLAREGNVIRIQHCGDIWWMPRKLFHEIISELIVKIAECHSDLREYEPARLIIENHIPSMGAEEEICSSTGININNAPASYKILKNAISNNPESRILLAAARMGFGNLNDFDLSQVLQQIETYRAESKIVENLTLKRISSFVPSNIRNGCSKNFMQGYFLATYMREYMNMTEMEPLDVDALVCKLGLDLIPSDFPGSILALAIWDNGSPRIHLNRAKLDKKENLRRSSICHEICHILIDRQGARPMCDLLIEDEMSDGVERRARAFAAELLLPRAWAISFLSQLDNKSDVNVPVQRSAYGTGWLAPASFGVC